MVFNSLLFLVFFAIVLCLHYLPIPWRAKKTNLLFASYVFYAAWNPPFVILLWLSTLIDWWAAAQIAKSTQLTQRRIWLCLSLVFNLGLLGYFKYGEFLLENWQTLMAVAGVQYVPPVWDIILPVGISFYTFQTMSYTLDVYLKRAEPTRSFLDFALFVTFFPQLVAGPIVRPSQLVPQFSQPRVATSRQLAYGLFLITLGLFGKVVIADGFLAPAVEGVYGTGMAPGTLDAWIATLAFSGQIFCDFAGYSTIAIGTALCLGFSLPDNFRSPYAAVGFSDFWRRWHISLSTWLRDYLYIPLGGNRHGSIRTIIALMLTMLLGGLWHGASWTFVVWGGLHGLFLVAERSIRKVGNGVRPGLPGTLALMALTYVLVTVTWVFFRAADFPEATRILNGMAGLNGEAKAMLPWVDLVSVSVIISCLLTWHFLMRHRRLEVVVRSLPGALLGLWWALMIIAVVVEQGEGNAFIYFQF